MSDIPTRLRAFEDYDAPNRMPPRRTWKPGESLLYDAAALIEDFETHINGCTDMLEAARLTLWKFYDDRGYPDTNLLEEFDVAIATLKDKSKKPRPTVNELIKRRDDMGQGHLVLLVQDDGDVIVEVRTRNSFVSCPPSYQVEFCAPGTGGGGSIHTWEALRVLAVAMEQDNKEKAQ